MLMERYPINANVAATVVKAIDRGVVVMVDSQLEGFVPFGQCGLDNIQHPGEHFIEGDELQCKVTRIDLANHRMVLSVKAWLLEQDAEVNKEFLAKYSPKRAAVPEPTEEKEGSKPKGKGRRGEARSAEVDGAEGMDAEGLGEDLPEEPAADLPLE